MRWPRLPPFRAYLVGPLFGFDLVRLARGGRLTRLRVLYALALLAVLWSVNQGWLFRTRPSPEDEDPLTALGQLAESFTLSLLITQCVAAVLLTPFYLATAIAEERNRGTLELLYTTHLHSHEIILGKYLARVLALSETLLTGLPIVALISFLGGVNLWLVFGGYLIAIITLLQVGSASILCGVISRGTGRAIVLSYFLVHGIIIFCMIPPVTALSNPIMAVIALDERLRRDSGGLGLPVEWLTGHGPPGITLELVLSYALFQGVFTVLFLALAIINLRKLAQTSPMEPEFTSYEIAQSASDLSLVRHPSASEDPLWRKEAFSSQRVTLGLFLVQMVYVPIVVSFTLLGLFHWWWLSSMPGGAAADETLSRVFRGFSVMMIASLCLADALRTVESISRERERRTLESLLTLPLERDELLRIKWLAGGWYFRRAGHLSVLFIAIGVLAGMVHPIGAIALALAGLVHFEFFSLLGLWLSLTCRTTAQARLILGVIIASLTTSPLWLPLRLEGIQLVFNPLLSWWTLGFGWYQLAEGEELWRKLGLCLLGLVIYAGATQALWQSARKRFRADPLGTEQGTGRGRGHPGRRWIEGKAGPPPGDFRSPEGWRRQHRTGWPVALVRAWLASCRRQGKPG